MLKTIEIPIGMAKDIELYLDSLGIDLQREVGTEKTRERLLHIRLYLQMAIDEAKKKGKDSGFSHED